MERENSILRDANRNLLDSAYSVERERQYHASEHALKVQIAQLEATIKRDLEEKKILQVIALKHMRTRAVTDFVTFAGPFKRGKN